MMPRLTDWKNARRWGGRFAALTLCVALAGCGQEGAGSIKIENAQAVREKIDGNPAGKKPVSDKQAKALQAEEEAAKKHPKLR